MTQVEVKKKLDLIKKELLKAIFEGTANSYQIEIENFFMNHPSRMRTTLQYFKPIKVRGNYTKDIIASFSKGYPALLQLGPNGSASGYTYPYNKDKGTFIYFDDEPHLEDWAETVRPDLADGEGLYVGKESTTHFGSSSNQWVTKAGIGLKKNSRPVILQELKNIKLK